MGMESFRVELRGEVSADRIRNAVLALPGAAVNPTGGFIRGEYFRWSDGHHVFEFHLFEYPPSPPILSLRFALAHPPSVDGAFLDLVRRLMTTTGLRVRVLANEVPDEFDNGFDLQHFCRFTGIVLNCIAEERRDWIDMFGPQTLAASTSEVFRRIILPQCRPTEVTHKDSATG